MQLTQKTGLAKKSLLDKNNDQAEQTDAQVMQPVMQPEADVTQRYVQKYIESRLSMLETELNEQKEIILRNTDTSEEETRNKGLKLNQTKRGLVV